MKKKLIFSLYLIIVACGLHRDGMDIIVVNKADFKVQNVRIFPTFYPKGALELGVIMPGKKAAGFLDMSNIPASDGVILLQFINDKGEEITWGGSYYTNGAPLDRRNTFVIYQDTIIVRSSYFGISFKGKDK